MKIFADTNFLVSAFSSNGFSAKLFQFILTHHFLQTGEFNLIELKRILKTKLKLPSNIVDEAEILLRQFHVEPIPLYKTNYFVRDSDDDWVLASAIVANADILVTGDKDLLILTDTVKELKILTPRECWDYLLKDNQV